MRRDPNSDDLEKKEGSFAKLDKYTREPNKSKTGHLLRRRFNERGVKSLFPSGGVEFWFIVVLLQNNECIVRAYSRVIRVVSKKKMKKDITAELKMPHDLISRELMNTIGFDNTGPFPSATPIETPAQTIPQITLEDSGLDRMRLAPACNSSINLELHAGATRTPTRPNSPDGESREIESFSDDTSQPTPTNSDPDDSGNDNPQSLQDDAHYMGELRDNVMEWMNEFLVEPECWQFKQL